MFGTDICSPDTPTPLADFLLDLENSGENQNPDCSLADILKAAENDDYEPNSKEHQLSTDPNDEGKPAKIKPSKLKSKPKKKSNAEDD